MIDQLLTGLLVTLRLSGLAVVIATLLGTLVGLGTASKLRSIRFILRLYIDLFRSVPLILLLFFVYYAVPQLFSISLPAYPAAVAALSLHSSAYVAEVVRGSVNAIPVGQWNACRAVGLGYRHTMTAVILPQAMRIGVPPLIGVYIILVKESSLAAVIGYVDLLGAGLALRESEPSSSDGLRILLAVGFLYFLVCYGLSIFGRFTERRLGAPHYAKG